jgi:hypothetical protein
MLAATKELMFWERDEVGSKVYSETAISLELKELISEIENKKV